MGGVKYIPRISAGCGSDWALMKGFKTKTPKQIHAKYLYLIDIFIIF
jgi:hypothetical protein